MTDYKIVITGPPGAGKTTAIQMVSDTAPVSTDVVNTDPTVTKRYTTVGLDYGELKLPNGDRVRIFGTPGQHRFAFLWPILSRNALGLIVLCDNSGLEPLKQLNTYLDGFRQEFAHLPCVIGVGHLDTHPAPPLDEYAAKLVQHGKMCPVIAVDVRRRADVVLLIEMLLMQLESEC